MAQVTLLHLLNLRDNDDDDVEEDLLIDRSDADSHNYHLDPYWSTDFDVFTSDLTSDFLPSDLRPRNRIPLVDSSRDEVSDEGLTITTDLLDRGNQVNFVMDLFHQRVEQSQLSTAHVVIDPDLAEPEAGFDPNFGIIEGNDEMDPNQLDLDLGLGFYVEPTSANDGGSGFVEANFDNEVQFVTGLRLVDVGSDTDSEVNVDFGIAFNDRNDDEADGHDCDGATDDDDPSLRLCWDSFQIEDHRVVNEEFEWEEVDEGVDEREVLSMFLDDDDVSVTAREERVGVLGNLEWEVLLNVQNLDPNAELGHEGFNEFGFGDHEHDEYNYPAEYELFFGQFVESENAIMGKPPAAKHVVKDLPEVVLSKDDLEKNDVICAICKDEMGVGEVARQLPCSHKYHGDCILPWLGIRNTCPVCRYELPTDDPDYERRREQIAGQVH
ncbi:hypothetical protein M9H77_28884 [Catharanthus roseus]|uniref:Uncharacterized protein n=1 Tax=Catharanthus roseus TaxID=4058 RepID=A0ACC0AKR7_CATRO|nr:hypothetical protein M9H77_28884 [Catharanthus roseus]